MPKIQKYFPELDYDSTAGCIFGTLMVAKRELAPKGFKLEEIGKLPSDSIFKLLVIASFQDVFQLLDDGHPSAENQLMSLLRQRNELDWAVGGELRAALNRGAQLYRYVIAMGQDRVGTQSADDYENLTQFMERVAA
jgi:hypothetical protein